MQSHSNRSFFVNLFHVPLQIARLLARVIAFLAGIGFFTSVGKHVPPQIA